MFKTLRNFLRYLRDYRKIKKSIKWERPPTPEEKDLLNDRLEQVKHYVKVASREPQ